MYKLALELSKLKKLGVLVSVKLRTPAEKDKVAILNRVKQSFDKIEGSFNPYKDNLKPDADGLVFKGKNQDERAFSLVVSMPAKSDLAAVIIQGKKSESISHLSSVKIGGRLRTFVRNVSTYPVYGGYSTKPQDNSVRIVSVRNGKLQIFSVAVTTRLYDEEWGAHNFLVVQEMYRAKLFRYREELVAEDEIVTDMNEYPGFNRWEAMRELVSDMIPLTEREALPVFKLRIEVEAKDLEFVTNKEGQVIFFDINKGFGFAKTKSGNWYFKWTQTDTDDRLPYFFTDQKINFDSIEESRLVGVRPAQKI